MNMHGTGTQTDAQRDMVAAALLAALHQLDMRKSYGVVVSVVWRDGSVSPGFTAHEGADAAAMIKVVARLPDMLRTWLDNIDEDGVTVGLVEPDNHGEDN